MSDVSIVIPAYNEEGAIAETVEAIRAALQTTPYAQAEIVVVDDGSHDKTGDIAKTIGVTYVRNPHNIGYGMSLKRGISAAANDTIVITDADQTYPADKIATLLDIYFRDGFDMVVGARTGEHYRESILKSPLRKILRFLVEFTAGRKVPDINSGMRVFSRQAVMEHFPRLCDTFSFTTSMTLAYMMTGRFVAYHQIAYHERIGSSKVRLFRDSLRTLQYIVEAITFYNPLKIFILLSACLFLSGFILLVTAMLTQLNIAYVLGLGSWLSSVFVFCIGLLAVLLKQILKQR